VPNDRENILSALREKPLKVYEVMKRANVANEEACQSLLLKMRDEGLVKFDIHKGQWFIGWFAKNSVAASRITDRPWRAANPWFAARLGSRKRSCRVFHRRDVSFHHRKCAAQIPHVVMPWAAFRFRPAIEIYRAAVIP
jgi:DNA-binding IclR family transcriptional regulator